MDNLNEQLSLLQSTIANLQKREDEKITKELSSAIDKTQKEQNAKEDKVKEQLDALSRRLQVSKRKVEESKAKRVKQGHANAMTELKDEQASVEETISKLESTKR